MNTTKFLWIAVAALFIVVTFFALNSLGVNVGNPVSSDEYYAVYLTSGDIYFGKLSRFPSLALTEVYFLVRGKDFSGADAFMLQRLGDAVWGPQDTLYLNAKNILWKTKLSADGAAMKAIVGGGKNAGSLPYVPEMLPDFSPEVASGTGS